MYGLESPPSRTIINCCILRHTRQRDTSFAIPAGCLLHRSESVVRVPSIPA